MFALHGMVYVRKQHCTVVADAMPAPAATSITAPAAMDLNHMHNTIPTVNVQKRMPVCWL